MTTITLGLGDWESFSQDVPRQKLRNMYVVENPSSADGVSRVSRPTLTLKTTLGSGPTFKVWQQPNVFNGDSLLISGTELYRCNFATDTYTLVGDIPGTSVPELASTLDTAAIIRDGLLYFTDGLVVTPGVVPDDQLVSSVASINGYFIICIKNTQKFYWTEPGDTTIDPLNFASAERIPDPIVSVNIVLDEVWFLGLSGPEVWAPTGDATAPFQRINGRVYKEGCFSEATVVTTAIGGIPALLWVTDTKSVVKSQGAPEKVSNESVEELLKTSDELYSWVFRYNRHDFYVVSSPLFTLVYDITAGLWSKWDTYLLPYWVAQGGSQIGTTVYTGSYNSNEVFTLSEDVSDNGLPVIREVSGFVPNSKRAIPCNEVIVYVNSGWTPSYELEPTLEMRWSDNLGATWSAYQLASLGNRGQYARSVSYRSLGQIKDPGRVFEFRMADFVRFRIDYATMNERLEG